MSVNQSTLAFPHNQAQFLLIYMCQMGSSSSSEFPHHSTRKYISYRHMTIASVCVIMTLRCVPQAHAKMWAPRPGEPCSITHRFTLHLDLSSVIYTFLELGASDCRSEISREQYLSISTRACRRQCDSDTLAEQSCRPDT